MEKVLGLRIPATLMAWLKASAKAERRPVSNLVRVAIEDYLERHHADLKEDG